MLYKQPHEQCAEIGTRRKLWPKNMVRRKTYPGSQSERSTFFQNSSLKALSSS